MYALTGTDLSNDSTFEMMFLFLIFLGCFAPISSHLEKPELLSELPIEKLLQKKKSLIAEIGFCNSSKLAPEASALIRPLDHMQIRQNPLERGHFEEQVEEEEEEEWEWMPMVKGKGIGQIFDTSVTALAFLAFGGYLVCLIIHAIKHKHDDENEKTTATQLQQLLLNQQRPGSTPLMTLRPGRRKRNLLDADPILLQFVDTGYLFAEAFFSRK